MEEKSNKGLLVVILIIVLVAFFAVGYLLGKKTSDTEAKKDVETKEEEKKVEKKEHKGCAVCDESGGICCPTDPDKTYEHNFLEVQDTDDTYKTEEIKLNNGEYEYNIKVIKNKGTFKIEANGKVVLDKAYVLDNVFVMDNGMLGVEYHWDLDQALFRMRSYFDKDLKLVKTIEGIKNVDLFATEYNYVIRGNVCIEDKYVEVKTYKATINSDSIDTELVNTTKESNCAGITG